MAFTSEQFISEAARKNGRNTQEKEGSSPVASGEFVMARQF